MTSSSTGTARDGSELARQAAVRRGNSCDDLDAVAALSAGNVWAAGYDDLNCESDGTDAGPSILIEHWNGRAWKYAENPGYSGGFFNAIVPLSARNIWAVGTAADPNSGDFTGTRIQHWDGTKWSDVTTPPAGLGANLWGAAAVSANAIWAVGWSYTSRLTTRSLVERWNGRKWKVVPSAHISEGDALYGAAAIPGSDRLWAVGGLVERWNGRLWKIFGKQPPAHPLPKQGCKGSHTVTCTLVATGEHSFLVPKGVTSLHVVSVGGRGAPEAPGYGGLGARVTADLKVTGGEKLFVDVGGNGGLSKGGWNGGGAGGFGEHKCSFYSVPSCGGGGGGATAVQTCSSHSTSCVYTGIPSTDPRLLVAAGGGGAGGFPNLKASQGTSAGGSAGGTSGADGANGEEGGFGGKGATPSTGGAGGAQSSDIDPPNLSADGRAGSIALGGAGGTDFGDTSGNDQGGGGGGGGAGGGFFGGGGGGAGPDYNDGEFNILEPGGGGGAGSSYVDAKVGWRATFAVDASGVPLVKITYARP